jgi:DNA-binding LytR/AlgR family response regulator
MNAPTAVIAEDEPLVRRELREMLAQLWPDLNVLAEAADGYEALAALERFQPAVLFLDIHMPGLSGLEVAGRLNGRAHVVFVTAFDEYAVAAFEQGALDYVLKPISATRLRMTLERLRARLLEPPADLSQITLLLKEIAAAESKYLKWLTVPDRSELKVLAVTEVSYLRADTKYTTVVTPHGAYLVTSSLRQMKDRLDPRVFWQIHRGIVVNVAAIDRIYRTFRGKLEVKLKGRDELLPVSAAHAHLFREMRQ